MIQLFINIQLSFFFLRLLFLQIFIMELLFVELSLELTAFSNRISIYFISNGLRFFCSAQNCFYQNEVAISEACVLEKKKKIDRHLLKGYFP